jgi:hypothetical protein
MKAAHKQFRAGRRDVAPMPRVQDQMKEVSFAACTDAQTAQEIDGHGVFTTAAMSMLRNGVGGMTNADFLQRVVAAFGAGAAEQTPWIDCATASRTKLLLAPVGESVAAVTAGGLEAVLARLDEIDRRVASLGV